MKRLLSVVTLLALLAESGSAASLCKQTFSILGKTHGERCLFVIDEYMAGECQCDDIFVVFISQDSTCTAVAGCASPTLVKHVIDSLPLEDPIEVFESNGLFSIDDSITVRAPDPSPSFEDIYEQMQYERTGCNVGTWRTICKSGCLDDVIIEGVRSTRMYAHQTGLYKNYTIDRVLYYRDSGYVVVITRQPKPADRGDTMHGVLIYRLGE